MPPFEVKPLSKRVFAEPVNYSSYPVAAGGAAPSGTDKYVDRVLSVELPRQFPQMDPWVLVNFNRTLDRPNRISAYFRNFTLTGFRFAQRLGSCLRNNRTGGRVDVTCTVAFERVRARSTFNLRYRGRLFNNAAADTTYNRILAKFNITAERLKTTKADFKFLSEGARPTAFTGITGVPIDQFLRAGYSRELVSSLEYFRTYYTPAIIRAVQRIPFPY
ncbi:hypothetical protein HPB48_002603 [Haemaphysalis longicornis]|uniref:Uncharacterized protein n=1 Tax=Haemaphysalis longicornis TaxID=44386 RepID=A0A9J6G1W7_HAELO|nr:hypothetical protein HPB48_002603 [Haemaphysalis longicornis]